MLGSGVERASSGITVTGSSGKAISSVRSCQLSSRHLDATTKHVVRIARPESVLQNGAHR